MKAKKGSRNIIVDDVKYRWRSTGNDGYIVVTIWPDVLPGAAITGNFTYQESIGKDGISKNGLTFSNNGSQIVITNRIIKRIINYCRLHKKYDPYQNGKQINLQIADNLVDLSDVVRAVRKNG